jgi:hypothetical protein
VAATTQRDAQRLKEELAALQRMWRLNEQAEKLERAAAREEAAAVVEEREARAARRDEQWWVAVARVACAADL